MKLLFTGTKKNLQGLELEKVENHCAKQPFIKCDNLNSKFHPWNCLPLKCYEVKGHKFKPWHCIL